MRGWRSYAILSVAAGRLDINRPVAQFSHAFAA